MVRAAHQVRRGKPSAEDGKKREQHQRNGHVLGRLVHVNLVMVEALFAEEREEHQPEHVERREARADQAQQPQRSDFLCGPEPAASRISSLLKKPAKPGMPAMASVAMNIVQ